MQSLSTSLATFFNTLEGSTGKLAKAAYNNARFRSGVCATWKASPAAAQFILEHINALYILKEDYLCKGSKEPQHEFVLVIYLDDPIARAEIDTHRELLKMHLQHEGVVVDSIRLLSSRGGMRQRKAYPDASSNKQAFIKPDEIDQEVARFMGQPENPNSVGMATKGASPATTANEETVGGTHVSSGLTSKATASKNITPKDTALKDIASEETALKTAAPKNTAPKDPAQRDKAAHLEMLKRAMCLTFSHLQDDDSYTRAVLERIENASIEELPARGRHKNAYRCVLYTSTPDELRPILQDAYGPAICSNARVLGLCLVSLKVQATPSQFCGQKIFR